ncbi:unnamed protein product [Strongylus vulgaris]|uniref:Uncharacterized protein n=1 Tax=Strongylus vulgaris TaxID=40348 RepID=A0A3P7JIR7_STRVU|nr:unnamed protein product [Strongylus vulgaris]
MNSLFYLDSKGGQPTLDGQGIYRSVAQNLNYWIISQKVNFAINPNSRPGSSTDVSSIDSGSNNMHRSVTFNSCNDYYEKESSMPRRIGFKQRASQVILQVPVEHLRRIRETEGIGSISRETQHFSPVRKLMESFINIVKMPKVSFLISENGMDFPMITMCNFNPVKKSYIKELNKTGEFSDHLLDYLMESLMDTEAFYGNADRAELHVGDRALQVYQKQYPNFTFEGFFDDAGCSTSFFTPIFFYYSNNLQ